MSLASCSARSRESPESLPSSSTPNRRVPPFLFKNAAIVSKRFFGTPPIADLNSTCSPSPRVISSRTRSGVIIPHLRLQGFDIRTSTSCVARNSPKIRPFPQGGNTKAKGFRQRALRSKIPRPVEPELTTVFICKSVLGIFHLFFIFLVRIFKYIDGCACAALH